MNLTSRFGALLLLVLLLAACGDPATPTPPAPTATLPAPTATSAPPTATSAPPTATLPAPTATVAPSNAITSSNLMAALALIPSGAGSFGFTDWSLIKDYVGVPELTSNSSEEDRMQFMLHLNKDQAAASGYAVAHFVDHATVWGWDSTDLVWEANIDASSGPPVWILQLRPDFDMAPIVAHFAERGFTQEQYAGVPIYSHPMVLDNDWLTSTEFAILNTAVLSDQKMLVLSSAPAGVQMVLDARRRSGGPGTLAADPATASVATAIAPATAAAYILPGTAGCDAAGANPASPLISYQAQQDHPPLHQYSAMGVGYGYDSGTLFGLIVFHYDTAAAAQADLEARRTVANEALSLAVNQPIRNVLFSLEDITVSGNDLILRVAPVNDLPTRLFQMIYQHDMLFAACQ